MIEIRASEIFSKEDFYKLINELFDFSNRVSNLDGLFDELVGARKKIRIRDYKILYDRLGEYGLRIIKVFIDASFILDIDVDLIS
ncbi:MAG: barstar family protein [Anaerococcus sp.]|nr:barstar family protein [Anaerococcus sp.]